MKTLFVAIALTGSLGVTDLAIARDRSCRTRSSSSSSTSGGGYYIYRDYDGNVISKEAYDEQRAEYLRHKADFDLKASLPSSYIKADGSVSFYRDELEAALAKRGSYRTETNSDTTYRTRNNYGTSYGTENNYGTASRTINNYGRSNITINNYGTGRTTVNDSESSRTSVYRLSR